MLEDHVFKVNAGIAEALKKPESVKIFCHQAAAI